MIRFISFQQRLNGGKGAGGMPRWASWLAMAASFVVGIALFLVAASLALILIPIVAVVGAIAFWRLRSRLKAAGIGQPDPFARRPAKGGADIIDAEYRVIEPNERPRG